MNRAILDKKYELYKKSKSLRETTLDIEDKEKVLELRKKQDDMYKRFQFYSNIIKANDKIKRDK